MSDAEREADNWATIFPKGKYTAQLEDGLVHITGPNGHPSIWMSEEAFRWFRETGLAARRSGEKHEVEPF